MPRTRNRQPEPELAARPVPAGQRTAAPAPDPTAAAFFDVDNTLLQGASMYWFADRKSVV